MDSVNKQKSQKEGEEVMALPGTSRSRGVYDDKILWKKYTGWGAAATYQKLKEWCNANGMFDPAIGHASEMGPYWAVWRHAFEHPEECYPDFRDWWFDTDFYKRTPTFVDFLLLIKKRVKGNKNISGKPKYDKFVEHILREYNIDISEMEFDIKNVGTTSPEVLPHEQVGEK